MSYRDKDGALTVLIASGTLTFRMGAIFKDSPPDISPSWDRVKGMMLGLAIGDALGHPLSKRKKTGVDVIEYIPTRYGTGVPGPVGQLAFLTLEALVADGGIQSLTPLAERFSNRQVFGLDGGTSRFRHMYRSGVRPWYKCSQNMAESIPLARIAPILLPHLLEPSPELWLDVALVAALTHVHPQVISGCIALCKVLWMVLGRDAPPADPEWWPKTYCSAAQMAEATPNFETQTAQMPRRSVMWQVIWEVVTAAIRDDLPIADACKKWGSGTKIEETVSVVLYILSRYADDPLMAIVRAVNDTEKSDVIGAIVGACIGALHGAAAFPGQWIEGLLGRVGADDDGRVFDLLDQSQDVFYGR